MKCPEYTNLSRQEVDRRLPWIERDMGKCRVVANWPGMSWQGCEKYLLNLHCGDACVTVV